MNGVKMEIHEPLQSAGAGLTCCLIENGLRCHRPTGNASYSKRIAKTVAQRRLKLVVDQMVSFSAYIYFSFPVSSFVVCSTESCPFRNEMLYCHVRISKNFLI